MEYTYKEKTTGIFKVILRSDNASIPIDEANTDYQAYLKWVAEGNVAEEWNPNGN
jgi:hypothetical protein